MTNFLEHSLEYKIFFFLLLFVFIASIIMYTLYMIYPSKYHFSHTHSPIYSLLLHPHKHAIIYNSLFINNMYQLNSLKNTSIHTIKEDLNIHFDNKYLTEPLVIDNMFNDLVNVKSINISFTYNDITYPNIDTINPQTFSYLTTLYNNGFECITNLNDDILQNDPDIETISQKYTNNYHVVKHCLETQTITQITPNITPDFTFGIFISNSFNKIKTKNININIFHNSSSIPLTNNPNHFTISNSFNHKFIL